MTVGTAKKIRVRQLAVLAICAAPVVLAFSRSSPPASRDVLGAPGDLPAGQSDIFERPHGGARPGPVSEDEWNKAKEFLDAHSRNRMKMIEKISGEPREGLKRFLVNKWHSITLLQSQSPDLYKTRVREVELDDDVFGICQELKHNHNNAKMQAELNAKIAELFNLGLIERHERIGLVEKSLVDQKKSLDTDEHDKAHLIQQQYEIVLAHGVEGARFDNPRRTSPNPSSSSKSKPDSTPEE